MPLARDASAPPRRRALLEQSSAGGGLDELAELVTRRPISLFADAMARSAPAIEDALAGARVLVCGGAGTIGGETVRLISRRRTAALHVVDVSENYLADLVRDLRNQSGGIASADFRTYTLDYGGAAMANLLRHAPVYDVVLNFAAHKHVRGERDGYTLLQMVETNILKLARFKRLATAAGHGARFFSVSTDKAANPSSLMGSSKRIMEDVLFDLAPLAGARVTSARFANVAFSNGSLLGAMLRRISRREPIAVPEATRRYFVSPRESGELCLLASMVAGTDTIAIPALDPERELIELRTVAERLLERFGFEPVATRDEREAQDLATAGRRRYPVLLTPLDTGGEKPYEEFVAHGETARDWLPGLRLIERVPGAPLEPLLDRLDAITDGDEASVAAEIRAAFRDAVANFAHRASAESLDGRR